MGQNNISGAFTVNVVQDGISQPTYVQTQEAWSNNSTSASESTMPSDCVESDWEEGTPAKNKTYLWRRSRVMTLNTSTRQYTAGSWSYQRLSGENGTSIKTCGKVDYAYSASSTSPYTGNLPVPSSSNVGKKAIVQGLKKIFQCQEPAAGNYAWIQLSTTVSDGDAYTVVVGNLNGNFMSQSTLTNHLIQWVDEANMWIDLGEFKGANGDTYYTHIAWATATDDSGTIPTKPTGQTSTPNKSSVTGFSISPFSGAKWMGTLINRTVADGTTANLYTWSVAKGENAVNYKISLAGSVFAADPNTDTMIVNIKGKVYKIDGNTTSEYSGWGTADLMLYFQAEGENPDIVPTSEYTKTGAAFATTFYNGATWNDEVIFGAILTVGGVEVARESIQVEVYGQNGQQGQRGKMSRNIYYAGMWNEVAGTTFTASDYLAPYVNVGTIDAPNCKVYVGANGNKTFPSTQASYNNNADWDAMTTDFKYLITQAIFSNFAHLGAAIISGDYMISQYGYMLGFGGITQDILDASQYMNIDPNDVLGEDDMYDYTQLIWNDLTEKEIGSTSYQNFATADLVANRYYTFELEEHTEISGNVLDWTIQTSGGVTVANGTITSTASGYKKNDFLFKCNTAGTYILKMKARNSQAEVVIKSIYLRFAKFVPFYAVDMLQGKMVANRIIARGELHADSLYYDKREGNTNSETINVGNESIVNLGTDAAGSLVVLPAPSSSKGRRVEVFNSADYWQATWNGATAGNTFSCAYGSGLGIRTSYNIQANYAMFYCDGSTWWCLRLEYDV